MASIVRSSERSASDHGSRVLMSLHNTKSSPHLRVAPGFFQGIAEVSVFPPIADIGARLSPSTPTLLDDVQVLLIVKVPMSQRKKLANGNP